MHREYAHHQIQTGSYRMQQVLGSHAGIGRVEFPEDLMIDLVIVTKLITHDEVKTTLRISPRVITVLVKFSFAFVSE